jgi:hypothetical protein
MVRRLHHGIRFACHNIRLNWRIHAVQLQPTYHMCSAWYPEIDVMNRNHSPRDPRCTFPDDLVMLASLQPVPGGATSDAGIREERPGDVSSSSSCWSWRFAVAVENRHLTVHSFSLSVSAPTPRVRKDPPELRNGDGSDLPVTLTWQPRTLESTSRSHVMHHDV